MFQRLFLILSLIGLVGVGCSKTSTTAPPLPTRATQLPLLPGLRLRSPANGSTTASSTVTIIGETNMPDIRIDEKRYGVRQGVFSIPVNLLHGKNTFILAAGNGYTTTSIPLTITRQ